MSLINLAVQWEKRARRKWCDAEKEKDPMGKRLIEHGALCYQNCARELRESLISVSPQVSATQEGDQTGVNPRRLELGVMKNIVFLIIGIVFILMGLGDICQMIYYHFWVHQTADAAMSGVWALISFSVADKLYERYS